MATRRSRPLLLACVAALQLLLLALPTANSADSCTAADAQPRDLSGGDSGVLKR